MIRLVATVGLLSTCLLAQAGTIQLNNLVDLGVGNIPNAVNNNGMAGGQTATGQAFVYQNGTMTVLPSLGGSGGAVTDINDSGVAVGWSYTASGLKHAFKWSSSTGMVDLSSGKTYNSVAEGINSSGVAAGWISSGTTTRSAEWSTGGGLTTLFGGTNNKALGISDSGELVGVKVDSSGNPVLNQLKMEILGRSG